MGSQFTHKLDMEFVIDETSMGEKSYLLFQIGPFFKFLNG